MNMPSITLILSVNIPSCEFHDSDAIRLSSISVQSRWIQATFKLKSKCLRVNMPTLEFRDSNPNSSTSFGVPLSWIKFGLKYPGKTLYAYRQI